MKLNVETLGQVFTPPGTVRTMLDLRRNVGTILEPSCGAGAFSSLLDCLAIEIDPSICPQSATCMDFFDLPLSEKFDTIIGNPPYVGFKNIQEETKNKLDMTLFDNRTNLCTFFIHKCFKHLNDHGEIIFITPRDFLKATSALNMNTLLYENGTITDLIDLGDQRIFEGFSPNCIIWRYEKDNLTRKTQATKGEMNFKIIDGQLLFTSEEYKIPFSDLFFVKVGAVSGADECFESNLGNKSFVCSYTQKTGETKKMLYNHFHPYLFKFKDRLINRKIKKFSEKDWWMWGRGYHDSDEKRVYVNCKTRNDPPFFTHQCRDYDGAVLSVFMKNDSLSEEEVCDALNSVDWEELGFVCDGRYIFSQRALERICLPETFRRFLASEVLE